MTNTWRHMRVLASSGGNTNNKNNNLRKLLIRRSRVRDHVGEPVKSRPAAMRALFISTLCRQGFGYKWVAKRTSPHADVVTGVNPQELQKTNNMKTLLISLLALAASPAVADVYRCTSGNKTVYQDTPCPNAKLVENPNGLAPTRAEQMRASERAAHDQATLTRLHQQREIDERMASRRQADTVAPPAPTSPSYRPANTSGRPDRYYDRPDRYHHRGTEPRYTYRR